MKSDSLVKIDDKPDLKLKLASYPKRAIAAIVDGLIVSTYVFSARLSCAVIFAVLSQKLLSADSAFYVGSQLDEYLSVGTNITEALVTLLVCLLGPAIYFGYCESSKWQATPGKILTRLKTVDSNGESLTFWSAALRMLFAELLVAGFIMLPIVATLVYHSYWRTKMPGDTLQELSVIHAAFTGICIAFIFFTKNRQTLFDIAAKRVVVDARDSREEKIAGAISDNAKTDKLSTVNSNKQSSKKPLVATVAFLAIVVLGIVVPFSSLLASRSSPDYAERKKDLEQKMAVTGSVVYIIKDIPKGGMILDENTEEKEIKQYKIPQGAVASFEDVIGRKAKFALTAGDLLNEFDLEPGDPAYIIKVDIGKENYHQFIDMDGDAELAGKWDF